jgi:murein DD-endopeptidase MepM/ murein hydrolase activator NlpD
LPGSRISGGRLAALCGAALLLSACSVPRWPVEGPLSSPYGLRSGRGILPGVHRGVDVRVPEGTPVRAMKSGTIAFAGTMRGYGVVVIMDHGPHLQTVYAHLSELRVRHGERVRGRQVIGLSGRTGNATGPHLHFGVRRRGRPHDPVPLLGRPPG